ncbi:MAG: hypothetical protein JNM39_01690 [Bdellovibrionaceae bacterium]|nr:hypothetical protein [Pseudobdellovibrionaceae bacterium]
MLKYSLTFFFLLLSMTASAHDGHSLHKDSPGGPLLNGYPWGIFSVGTEYEKRVSHQFNDQEISLANRIFESVSSGLQVAFPIKLQNKGYRPFGDGQSNGHADFALWKPLDPPYLATLDRIQSKLTLKIHDSIDTIGKLSLRLPDGVVHTYIQQKENIFIIPVDLDLLGWNSLDKGKVIHVKPSHWGDWFPLKFQNPYVRIENLVSGIPSSLKNGIAQLPNPIGVDDEQSVPPLIQLMNNYKKNNYLLFTVDKVHSIYPFPNDPGVVEKTSGGNWTFLLNPTLWENLPRQTFKQLYSCFEGRAHWEESMKKTVSGTSWHHVGDEGEIILHSIRNEKRPLVTAIGEETVPPQDVSLAFGLTDVGYASKADPGNAFISVKGNYHWHPIHTTTPICVEVWTPLCKPSVENSYGFNCN